MSTTTTRELAPKIETPQRWVRAVARANDEGVRVSQVVGSGQWITTSGSKPGVAYGLSVTGNVAHDCECQAAQGGDPVCKHRAAFYQWIGALTDMSQEDVLVQEVPSVQAPVQESTPKTASRLCFWCNGTGLIPCDWRQEFVTCESCEGTGVKQAA